MAASQLADIEDLRRQLSIARTEIRNVRQSVFSMKKKQEKDVNDIKNLLEGPLLPSTSGVIPDRGAESGLPPLRPIAYMESLFRSKNGTPRQSGVCSQARGKFTVLKSIFNNPEHSLEGLDQFSHIWIFFLFHDNGTTSYHAKVRPPRLDGARTGVFSTRSPHRPNPVGLTLAKLELVEGATVEVSGIDIIDGTPILDIKPYIPQYDQPVTEQRHHSLQPITDEKSKSEPITGKQNYTEVSPSGGKTGNLVDNAKPTTVNIPESQIAGWISKPSLSRTTFTPHALEGLAKVSTELHFLKNSLELKKAIESILGADPRSVYRREKCSDRLYYFTVDTAHVTAWFDRERTEVLRVELTSGKEVDAKCTE